jgi:hypothetical protein
VRGVLAHLVRPLQGAGAALRGGESGTRAERKRAERRETRAERKRAERAHALARIALLHIHTHPPPLLFPPQLAEAFENDAGITIAKCDGTANDTPNKIQVCFVNFSLFFCSSLSLCIIIAKCDSTANDTPNKIQVF